ncbi:hypothetical protein K450DRAFT_259089 [Umbelopsis ramanniana AG]|uniref:AAA+ ATPase domain-containing protein n=1 Tax=Umbelopsis ramanniana AG TaxID=1314678 RepID=A0AAD5E1Y2_UMBRA|nr:uncharacterized protein K450DRAFT_259089 [Umbelopsis ramanniana AG]KAI8575946.1 hypothetical protein K450DRAFT_259089 [Umbelopsis ramanniana AG]
MLWRDRCQFFQLALNQSKIDKADLVRLRSLLLVGESGIGKSTAIAIAAKHYNLNVLQASIGSLVLEYPNQLEKGITQLLNRARELDRSIVILDNIELMFPKSGLSDIQLRLQVLDQLQNDQDNEPIIVGCCIDLASLDHGIKKSFDDVLQFEIPTPEERFHLFRNIGSLFQFSPTLDSKAIADRLHSYKLADVYKLVRIADEARCRESRNLITEEDLIESIQNIHAIGPGVGRTAEQPEAIKWSDIGGLEKAKSALMECTSWMHNNQVAYERLGGSPTTGVLLFGPPGTGKTLLAKAIANECSANFLAISIPELIKGEVGESEKAVARVFSTARRCNPCVIFFDELEAIFGSREATGNLANKLISQLMMELDNLSQGKERVLVVTATNHPEKIDRAILRPGRLDQHIFVALPSEEERLQILRVLAKKSHVDANVCFEKFANMTNYFTGADMQALLRKAGLCALKRSQGNEIYINEQDFLDALNVMKASVLEEDHHRYTRFELAV